MSVATAELCQRLLCPSTHSLLTSPSSPPNLASFTLETTSFATCNGFQNSFQPLHSGDRPEAIVVWPVRDYAASVHQPTLPAFQAGPTPRPPATRRRLRPQVSGQWKRWKSQTTQSVSGPGRHAARVSGSPRPYHLHQSGRNQARMARESDNNPAHSVTGSAEHIARYLVDVIVPDVSAHHTAQHHVPTPAAAGTCSAGAGADPARPATIPPPPGRHLGVQKCAFPTRPLHPVPTSSGRKTVPFQ